MKLENKKVNSKKLYSIGYCGNLNKYILECVVPGSVWYNRYYEISEEEFVKYDTNSYELDALVDSIRNNSYNSDIFLFSDMMRENTKEQAELKEIALEH